ncbi:hypothetical protein BV25DRAFT_1814700 [Artomyces pyxidatus]|uniref:Uncharacterized protein n=1 Tax=Artomyces pyxidatus TaxID=48021 RepID=A0ACB8SJK8_9AGAM|nr:hypothetical protein BV25DRAFT_1814700 [Artomyces pyxidatus]
MESPSPSPSKSQRRDTILNSEFYSKNSSSQLESPFTKSKDMWLDDSNIVLVCDSIGFRIHRGVLALHSSVFKDMFDSSMPTDDCEDCAVVLLQDTAEDLLLLFKMFYFRRYKKKDLPLETLRSLLRLSRKYTIDELFEEMTEYLTFIFPSSLEEYRSHHRRATKGPQSHACREDGQRVRHHGYPPHGVIHVCPLTSRREARWLSFGWPFACQASLQYLAGAILAF